MKKFISIIISVLLLASITTHAQEATDTADYVVGEDIVLDVHIESKDPINPYTKSHFNLDFKKAKDRLKSNETELVIVKQNFTSIDKEVLDYAHQYALSYGLNIIFHFDEVVNKEIVNRIYV